MGRRKKRKFKGTYRTVKKKEAVLEALERTAGNIKMACMQVKIARSRFYEWLKEDEYFKERYEEVMEGLIDYAESKLMQAISNNNITAIIFFLKTKGKHRGYVERVEVDTDKVQVVVDKDLLPEVKEEGK